MRGEEAQALKAWYLLDLGNQRRQAATALRVAVVVDVLAQQHDLARTLGDRGAALFENGRERLVAFATADLGHDAEGAVVIAAFDHIDEVADAGAAGDRHGLPQRKVVAGAEVGDELVVLPDRHHPVQLREAPPQSLALLADQAAGQGQRPVGRLPGPQLMELGVDLVLGGLAYHTGVEDGHVGPLQLGLLDITRGQQAARQGLGVGDVHLAPDGPDVERPGQRTSTRSLIPVRSSPSIEMSMKEGMQISSNPPGAT